jgi:hypothetical protein
MGTEHWLINKSNKTLFELGKGSFVYAFRPDENEAALFLYQDSFIKYFVDYLVEDYYKHEVSTFLLSKKEAIEYFTLIASIGSLEDYSEYILSQNKFYKQDLSFIDFGLPISKLRIILFYL